MATCSRLCEPLFQVIWAKVEGVDDYVDVGGLTERFESDVDDLRLRYLSKN